MSKKQIKIKPEDIAPKIGSTQLFSFILKSGSVVLAYPVSQSGDNLKVKNTRGQKMQLPLSQIEEIWAEEKVVS